MFSIDPDNNITAHASAAEARSIPASETYASAKELDRLAVNWPSGRLVEIWNSLPGQKPVKKFTDRKAAVRRVWDAIQHLTPSAGAQAPPVAPKKHRSRKEATQPNKPGPARDGSKAAQVLALLKTPGGATLKDIMAATNWQAHSVRGFISGTLGKKMGLTVKSEKGQEGERVYSID